MIAPGAICAETAEEAQYLHASQRLRRLLREQGDRGPIPSPEDAIARLGEAPMPPDRDADSEWPRLFVGPVTEVHERLAHMADELKVEELMLITVVHNHQARKRSYQLLAEAFGLSPD
jgi:alkanesulfonate monooxygenase SsuD/methylene tetrahydromethanopterin reductase-like flavin-dependent oxidoreductase (luciferase family)